MVNDRSPHAEIAAEIARMVPAPPERDLPPVRHNAIKEVVTVEIARSRSSRRTHGLLMKRPMGLALLAVLIAAAAVIGIPKLAHLGQPGVAAATQTSNVQAVQLLVKASGLALQQKLPVVADTDFSYVETVQAFAHGSASIGPDGVVQPRPGSGAVARLRYRQVWIPVADLCHKGLLRQGLRDIPLVAQGVTCPDRGSLNDPTYRLLASLPTDPRALLARIYAETKGAGANPDQEAFTTIGDLLRESIAPPDVTAALYRAAALIPGVALVAEATDAVGRHGVAVARSDGTTVSQWIFDPGTDQFLGERDVLIKDLPGVGHAGQVIGTTAVLAKAIVPVIGQTS